MYSTNYTYVKIYLRDHKAITGHLNIVGFGRVSDFLEQHSAQFLSLIFHDKTFLAINKNQILYIKDLTETTDFDI